MTTHTPTRAQARAQAPTDDSAEIAAAEAAHEAAQAEAARLCAARDLLPSKRRQAIEAGDAGEMIALRQITPEVRDRAAAHARDFMGVRFDDADEGERVTFETATDDGGRTRAINVYVLTPSSSLASFGPEDGDGDEGDEGDDYYAAQGRY